MLQYSVIHLLSLILLFQTSSAHTVMLRSIWTTRTRTEPTLFQHHRSLPLSGFREIDRDLKWIYSSVSSCNSILAPISMFKHLRSQPSAAHLCELQSVVLMHSYRVGRFISERQLHSMGQGREGISLSSCRKKWSKTRGKAFEIYRLCRTHLYCWCRLKY